MDEHYRARRLQPWAWEREQQEKHLRELSFLCHHSWLTGEHLGAGIFMYLLYPSSCSCRCSAALVQSHLWCCCSPSPCLWPLVGCPARALHFGRSDSSYLLRAVTLASFLSVSRNVFLPGSKFLLHGDVVDWCGSPGGCCPGTDPGQHRHISVQAPASNPGVSGGNRPENAGEG